MVDWASVVGKVAGMAGAGTLGGALLDLRDYLVSVGTNAAEKWAADYAAGTDCGFSRCPAKAFGRCDGCGKPTCLAHGRISDEADVLCQVCVARVTGKTPGKKRPEARAPRQGHDPERLAALEVMGLPPTATWPEVQARFRSLTAKWHPDKHKDPEDKARAEKMFKQVSAAYETLKRRAAA